MHWRVGASLRNDIFRVDRSHVVIPRRHVTHLRRQIVHGKVERNLPLIQDRHPIVQNCPADRKIENLVRIVSRRRMFWLRLIRRPVRINDQVHHRVIALEVIDPDLRPEEGKDLQPHEKPIDMRVRNLPRRLKPMNGEIVGFEFKVRQVPSESLQLDPPPGRLLQLGDDLTPYLVLKPRRARIPQSNAGANKHDQNRPDHGE